MKKHVPQSMTTLKCPVSQKPCEVNFEINVFRSADHGGVEAATCSEFLQNHGVPTCGQECIHSPQAKNIHEQEIRNHQRELSKIGQNVIG